MNTLEGTAVTSVENPVIRDNKVLSGSFKWMAFGLFISGVVSIYVGLSPSLLGLIYDSSFGFLALIITELAVVIYLSRRILSMSKNTARMLFLAYAILSGLTLSVVFFAYDLVSIISIFFSTAVMFSILAIYGARTKKDLSGYGKFAYFALIGLIIALVINLFIYNGLVDLILSCVGVIVFTVLTAYDVQKIKILAENIKTEDDNSRVIILGALTLYLDFVNLFLDLLRIFGKRK